MDVTEDTTYARRSDTRAQALSVLRRIEQTIKRNEKNPEPKPESDARRTRTLSNDMHTQEISAHIKAEETIKGHEKQKSVSDGRGRTHGRAVGGDKITLPKGSSTFQQVLEEIHREMETEKNIIDDETDNCGDLVKDTKEHGRHKTVIASSANFYRTQSVSGGYSGAFVRNHSRRMLLRSKSSREILFEKLDIRT